MAGAAIAGHSPLLRANGITVLERQLTFSHLHTGEKLRATYWADGEYIDSELQRVNYLMRDFRSDEVIDIDKKLLDVLFLLQQQTDSNSAYHIISAYRSPSTNARLRQRSKGVAKRSLHIEGKAIDIRLPGVELTHLRNAALQLNTGGVGYYPKPGFVHIDTGRPRFW